MNNELLNKDEYFEKKPDYDRFAWIEELAESYAEDYKKMIIDGMREWTDQEICEEYEKMEDGE